MSEQGEDNVGVHHSVGFKDFPSLREKGENRLRTWRFAQPGVLKEGDILATGRRVMDPPEKVSTNGDFLVRLSGGGPEGHLVKIPAEIPVALLVGKDFIPAGYVDN